MVSLEELEGPEIFIGLVSPVGTDLEQLCLLLKSGLQRVGYSSEIIRLSSLLHDIAPWEDLEKESLEDERIQKHVNAARNFRETIGEPSALAALSVPAIRERRRELTGDSKKPASRTAFILRSLKRPEEVALYHRIYGPSFWLLAAYSSRDERVASLAQVIAESHRSGQVLDFRSQAERLIKLDEDEAGTEFGQQVRKVFPRADAFFDVRDRAKLEVEVNRFVEALFNHQFHTPTSYEYGMFLAYGAALRSSALGRQVGATIMSPNGTVISLGTNEVPKAGGGLYSCEDSHDKRDFRLGRDLNDQIKRTVLADILEKLQDAGWLSEANRNKPIEDLSAEAEVIVKDAQVMDLIEFFRPVHAEMAALMDAAIRGVSVDNCWLLSTTFPWHECARHIIAAGIRRVVYIEPYPKSRAVQLHSDAILVDPSRPQDDMVNFMPFVGISPNRYLELFAMDKRKDRMGNVLPWKPAEALPRMPIYKLQYMLTEETITNFISEELQESGMLEPEERG